MLDNSAWDKIADVVGQADFYRHDHRLIFDAIYSLAERNEPIDVVTISEFLDSQNNLNEVGGLGYLGTLAKDTPSAANIRAYANIVRERSMLRKLIEVGGEIADLAHEAGGEPVNKLVDMAERKVFEISESGKRQGSGFVSLKEVMPGALDKLDELYHSDGEITGVSTGFTDLDRMTAGLQPGDLIIVAGRPSMGKTSFSMNIAEHAALAPIIQENPEAAVPTAIFSMEMSAEQLSLRLVSSLAQV
ncbi:MAG: replicative DNA helicase, partial [Gammaproteobacteria bacterium]